MPVLGKASLAKLEGVHPDLVKVIKESIKECPVDFSIVYGVRSTEEQKRLYALGRTVVNPDGKSNKKPLGNIVTQKNGTTNKSNHQVKSDGFGHAIDFVPYINGKMDWNATNEFKVIAAHIVATAKCLGVAVVWGGSWRTFKDLPHIELA